MAASDLEALQSLVKELNDELGDAEDLRSDAVRTALDRRFARGESEVLTGPERIEEGVIHAERATIDIGSKGRHYDSRSVTIRPGEESEIDGQSAELDDRTRAARERVRREIERRGR